MREWDILGDIVIEEQQGDREVESIRNRISNGKEEKGLNIHSDLSVHYLDRLFVPESCREKLVLPPQLSGIHNVFHVSMPRKYEPDPSHMLDWVDFEVYEDASYEEQPVQILDTREQVLRGKTIPLVKVLWRHHGVEEVTWERETEVRSKYPDLFENV
ncbi:uncharacterized protein LOC114264062 [Camellia sinensis]|uniref:uncharacterized protein LOC114264062 n=1 Tax=Camellia sinensis TaxID=4442 RepID=UPI001036CBE5|nr:uncharacterized protein LOC114264062 [Camellia sinensis]